MLSIPGALLFLTHFSATLIASFLIYSVDKIFRLFPQLVRQVLRQWYLEGLSKLALPGSVLSILSVCSLLK